MTDNIIGADRASPIADIMRRLDELQTILSAETSALAHGSGQFRSGDSVFDRRDDVEREERPDSTTLLCDTTCLARRITALSERTGLILDRLHEQRDHAAKLDDLFLQSLDGWLLGHDDPSSSVASASSSAPTTSPPAATDGAPEGTARQGCCCSCRAVQQGGAP